MLHIQQQEIYMKNTRFFFCFFFFFFRILESENLKKKIVWYTPFYHKVRHLCQDLTRGLVNLEVGSSMIGDILVWQLPSLGKAEVGNHKLSSSLSSWGISVFAKKRLHLICGWIFTKALGSPKEAIFLDKLPRPQACICSIILHNDRRCLW